MQWMDSRINILKIQYYTSSKIGKMTAPWQFHVGTCKNKIVKFFILKKEFEEPNNS